jgi:hypothetical protein
VQQSVHADNQDCWMLVSPAQVWVPSEFSRQVRQWASEWWQDAHQGLMPGSEYFSCHQAIHALQHTVLCNCSPWQVFIQSGVAASKLRVVPEGVNTSAVRGREGGGSMSTKEQLFDWPVSWCSATHLT